MTHPYLADPERAAAFETEHFDFAKWAIAAEFEYPPTARDFFQQCESPAEAFFAREYVRRRSAIEYRALGHDYHVAITPGEGFWLNWPIGPFRPDALLFTSRFGVAIEIDGQQHNHPAQRGTDLRKDLEMFRRGLCVVRFTAKQVFIDAAYAWNLLDEAIAHRSELLAAGKLVDED